MEEGFWKGYAALRHLFVFGASYCSIRDFPYDPAEPVPTDELPLGVPYPGLTYSGDGKANWVGILVKEHTQPQLLAYNYAEGGNTTKDLVKQVRTGFIPHVGSRKGQYGTWTAEDSLFAIWIGINDVGGAQDPVKAQKLLFELLHDLYETGARNFLIFNVPPPPRRPVKGTAFKAIDALRELWNNILPDNIDAFKSSHPGASVFLFDAHRLFEDIVDHPQNYGFPDHAGRARDGVIWVDHIHPTEDVHAIIAQEVASFLRQSSVPAGSSRPEQSSETTVQPQ